MSTLFFLPREAKRRRAHERFSGADHAVAEGPCPGCQSLESYECGERATVAGFRVQGRGRRIAPDDRAYEADAVAMCCDGAVGTLRLETNTLFGLREDEAVSRLGVRIY